MFGSNNSTTTQRVFNRLVKQQWNRFKFKSKQQSRLYLGKDIFTCHLCQNRSDNFFYEFIIVYQNLQMLSSIYEKFQNVQDGITSSFRGLAVGHPLPNAGLNRQNAGRELLARYQDDWKWIRSLAEVNATNAKDIDRKIGSCHQLMQKRKLTWDKFNSEISQIEHLINSTESVVNGIGQLRQDIRRIEEDLIDLENLIETEELYKDEENEKMKLNLYREHKLHSLDKFRANLSHEHNEKLRRREEMDYVVQSAKSEAYKKCFDEEMEAYKNTGQIPARVLGPDKSNSTDLESVQLDPIDSEELTAYLES